MSSDYSKLKTENEQLKKETQDHKNRLSVIENDYRELKTDFENNKKRDEDDRADNAQKFAELYTSRNKTNDTLVELTTTLKMISTNIDQRLNSLEKKIDELKVECKGQ